MRSKLITIRTLGGAAALALAMVCLAGAQQQQLQGKTAEQVFKNIQVLNGTPADQVVPTMHVIARDLNVTCEFCHDPKDRSKDGIEAKDTARSMIKMMRDINKNFFGGRTEVTCNTCHNGHNDPSNVPTLPQFSVAVLGPGGVTPPTLPSVDQVLENYAKAIGGEQAIRKVTSLKITGTRQNYRPGDDPTPPPFPVEHDWKAPNLSVITAHTANGVAGNGFDGTMAWVQDARGRVTELSGNAMERAKREANFFPTLDMKQMYQRMAVRGIEKIGDRETYMLAAIPQGGGGADRYYFDTQTGLLVRRLTVEPTDLGNSPLAIDYEDYRDAGNGVKIPYVLNIVGPTRPDCATITIDKIEVNVPIDASKFAKPASKGE